MSCSKWAYEPEICDGDLCVGDCDFCHKADDEEEVTVEEIVQSVRCKDCKHWNSETKGCKRNPSVEEWCDTDYCSYGERREP